MSAAALLARAFPRTLTGRVLLIILAGLAVAHAASFVLFELERARALNRFAAAEVAARITEYVRSNSAPATGPAAVPSQPQRPRSWPRLRWQDVEALGTPGADTTRPAASFTSELRRLLAEHFHADPVVWISARDTKLGEGPFVLGFRSRDGPPEPRVFAEPPRGFGAEERGFKVEGRGFKVEGRGFKAEGAGPGEMLLRSRPPSVFTRGAKTVTVALTLPGGRQALAETVIPELSLQVSVDAWISIALIFTVTALFSIWAVRLAVQPMRMLAGAADRLSRNIDAPPLPEEGAAEIRAAAHAFNRMQDRLKRHVNSRALAFAAMSHDIRTPLTRMRLRLEALDEDSRDKLAGDLEEIEAIAKTVLEVTRGLSAEETLERVDVNALVRRLLQDYVLLGKPIALSGSCEPVQARPVALRRALANLVDNALEYGEQVSVELGGTSEAATIRVCDRGPGIPEADLQKVVYPFYRVEPSRNRGTGGAGLGLAITKDLVEGQGGELVLANRAGGGLCASIELPR